MVENQSHHQSKVLRSDRGGEYDSNDFHVFVKQDSMKIQFTTRYTPQKMV
jgi:transposase InsO family protein